MTFIKVEEVVDGRGRHHVDRAKTSRPQSAIAPAVGGFTERRERGSAPRDSRRRPFARTQQTHCRRTTGGGHQELVSGGVATGSKSSSRLPRSEGRRGG